MHADARLPGVVRCSAFHLLWVQLVPINNLILRGDPFLNNLRSEGPSYSFGRQDNNLDCSQTVLLAGG